MNTTSYTDGFTKSFIVVNKDGSIYSFTASFDSFGDYLGIILDYKRNPNVARIYVDGKVAFNG